MADPTPTPLTDAQASDVVPPRRVHRPAASATWEHHHKWGAQFGDSTDLRVTRTDGGSLTISYGKESIDIRTELVGVLAAMVEAAAAWSDAPTPSEEAVADGSTTGPDGVPRSAEPWASGLRGAVLTGLMVSAWAAEAGPIRAAVMRDLYAEVADLLTAARASAWDEGYIARTGDTPRYRGPAEWGNPYRDYPPVSLALPTDIEGADQ